MSTYVLVHGAFHGGWCWHRVTKRLIAAGHRVYAPTLTGLGERSHLLDASVDLETHISDVGNVLECEELRDVVLVGHSYAGILISAVADRMRERLQRLVFVDAVVIGDGQTWSSVHPPHVVEARLKEAAESHAAAFAVPGAEAFGIEDPLDREWVARRLTPHPAGTYTQPLRLKHAIGNGLDKMYVAFTKPPLKSLDRVKTRLRDESGWQFVELAAGHDAMITAPDELSEVLMKSGIPGIAGARHSPR